MMTNRDYIEKLEEALELLHELREYAGNNRKSFLECEANEAIICIENVIDEL